MPSLDRLSLPIKWFLYLLAASAATIFLAGAWANSVNNFKTDTANFKVEATKRMDGHDAALLESSRENNKMFSNINDRLLRIEIVTGADKVTLPKNR